jgi:CBS domain-containing protein
LEKSLDVNEDDLQSGRIAICQIRASRSFLIAEKFPRLFRINENTLIQSSVKSPNLRRKIRETIGTDGAPEHHGREDMSMATSVGRFNWMKIVDIMTKDPLTVTPVETVGQADDLMNTNKIRQLPVVQGKDLVGIVTDRDIRSSLSGSLLEGIEAREKALNTEVREIMTTEPITVSPDDDLQEAVELMIDEKIGGIPVVDDAEGLVGIVTYVDILRCFLNRLQEE